MLQPLKTTKIHIKATNVLYEEDYANGIII